MNKINLQFKQILLGTLLFAGVSLFSGCQKDELKTPPFNAQRAFEEVEELVKISPRDAGTTNGWNAAQHIYHRLGSFGIEVQTDRFTDQTPDGMKEFRNVIGRIPGQTDQWILIASHFDTMPGIPQFQGANDSGSSTGILLELARMSAEWFQQGVQPEKGLLFLFFDGEEGIADYKPGDGLHGSRHFAQQMKQTGEMEKIDAMILLDMVGDRDLQCTIPFNSSPWLVKELLRAAHAAGTRSHFTLSRDVMITDDHVPFIDAGVPSIDLIDFHFGSAPGLNDYWHTKEDNLEHISVESLQVIGDTLVQLLSQMIF
jgi:hypothetical protein